MSKNIGYIDQVIRIILGITLLALVFVGPKTYWGFLGLIPLVTAFVGSCPLYSILKIQTCDFRKK